MNFLAIDVGNTRLKWAMYDRAHPDATLMAHGAEFLENIDRLSEGAWADLPAPDRMLGCIVAGDAVRRRVQDPIAGEAIARVVNTAHGLLASVTDAVSVCYGRGVRRELRGASPDVARAFADLVGGHQVGTNRGEGLARLHLVERRHAAGRTVDEVHYVE